MNYDNIKNDTKQYGDEYFRLYIIMTTSDELEKLQYVVK